MKPYAEMSTELLDCARQLKAQYREFQGKDLSWTCPEVSRAWSSWIFPWD